MAGELRILETKLNCIVCCIFVDFNASVIKTAMFCYDFFLLPISGIRLGKHQNTKVLAVERDENPQNITFAKVERWGGAFNREGDLYG